MINGEEREKNMNLIERRKLFWYNKIIISLKQTKKQKKKNKLRKQLIYNRIHR